jgi:hypothetical protein
MNEPGPVTAAKCWTAAALIFLAVVGAAGARAATVEGTGARPIAKVIGFAARRQVLLCPESAGPRSAGAVAWIDAHDQRIAAFKY